MVSLNIGQVCIKTTGGEGGHYCVVLKKLTEEKSKNSFVLVTGPKLLTGVKRRKSNINHLEPTRYTLDIKEDATDEEVIEAYKKATLVTKLDLKLPSAAELKAEKEKPVKETKKEVVKEKPAKEEKKTKDKK